MAGIGAGSHMEDQPFTILEVREGPLSQTRPDAAQQSGTSPSHEGHPDDDAAAAESQQPAAIVTAGSGGDGVSNSQIGKTSFADSPDRGMTGAGNSPERGKAGTANSPDRGMTGAASSPGKGRASASSSLKGGSANRSGRGRQGAANSPDRGRTSAANSPDRGWPDHQLQLPVASQREEPSVAVAQVMPGVQGQCSVLVLLPNNLLGCFCFTHPCTGLLQASLSMRPIIAQ